MSETTNKQHIQSTGEIQAGKKDKKAIEQAAARALLNEGVKGKYKIKPLKLYTLIALSKHVSHLKMLEGQLTAYDVIETADINARVMAKVAACAILNSRIKIRLFSRVLAWLLLPRMTPSDMKDLDGIIKTQSQVEDFFFCIQSMAGMRMMKPTTKEGKPSGEQSPE